MSETFFCINNDFEQPDDYTEDADDCACASADPSPRQPIARASTDRVDIAWLSCLWKKQLDRWYGEDPQGMKASVYRLGESLARKTREFRELGRPYLYLKNSAYFKLNVGPAELVRPDELTKVRFFAMLLRYVHEAAQRHANPEAAGFVSSKLVRRVEFDVSNPLFEYRFLLGEGFHLNHDAFEIEGARGRCLFLLGCLLLDFLPLRLPAEVTFAEYVASAEARRGSTLLAAARHSGVNPTLVTRERPLFQTMARLCRIRPSSSASEEGAENWKGRSLRRAVRNDTATTEEDSLQ